MIDSKDMTDEEFMEFINANKERMDSLMGERSGFKTLVKYNAKKAKGKVEDAADATEDTVKKVVDALFSPEVQKHMIGAGVEIMLGIGAIFKAMPVPKSAQPFVDKMEEVRSNAQTVYCSKNPGCPRKKAETPKSKAKKIELD